MKWLHQVLIYLWLTHLYCFIGTCGIAFLLQTNVKLRKRASAREEDSRFVKIFIHAARAACHECEMIVSKSIRTTVVPGTTLARKESEGCQILFTRVRRTRVCLLPLPTSYTPTLYIHLSTGGLLKNWNRTKRTENISRWEIYIQPCVLIHLYCVTDIVRTCVTEPIQRMKRPDMRGALFGLKVTKHRQRAVPSQHKCRKRTLARVGHSIHAAPRLRCTRALHFDSLYLIAREYGIDFTLDAIPTTVISREHCDF